MKPNQLLTKMRKRKVRRDPRQNPKKSKKATGSKKKNKKTKKPDGSEKKTQTQTEDQKAPDSPKKDDFFAPPGAPDPVPAVPVEPSPAPPVPAVPAAVEQEWKPPPEFERPKHPGFEAQLEPNEENKTIQQVATFTDAQDFV